jgi:hypothetical protein
MSGLVRNRNSAIFGHKTHRFELLTCLAWYVIETVRFLIKNAPLREKNRLDGRKNGRDQDFRDFPKYS